MFSEIDQMGQKTLLGKIAFTQHEVKMLKQLAQEGISSRFTISKLKEELSESRKEVRILTNQYKNLKEQTKDILAALEKAPERVHAFIKDILTTKTEKMEHRQKQKGKGYMRLL